MVRAQGVYKGGSATPGAALLLAARLQAAAAASRSPGPATLSTQRQPTALRVQHAMPMLLRASQNCAQVTRLPALLPGL